MDKPQQFRVNFDFPNRAPHFDSCQLYGGQVSITVSDKDDHSTSRIFDTRLFTSAPNTHFPPSHFSHFHQDSIGLRILSVLQERFSIIQQELQEQEIIMSTWGSYFAFPAKKKEDPAPTLHTKQEAIAPAKAKNLPTRAASNENKLYDIPQTKNNAEPIQRSASNAARLAKMFGYATPAPEPVIMKGDSQRASEKVVRAEPESSRVALPKSSHSATNSVASNRALSLLDELLDDMKQTEAKIPPSKIIAPRTALGMLDEILALENSEVQVSPSRSIVPKTALGMLDELLELETTEIQVDTASGRTTGQARSQKQVQQDYKPEFTMPRRDSGISLAQSSTSSRTRSSSRSTDSGISLAQSVSSRTRGSSSTSVELRIMMNDEQLLAEQQERKRIREEMVEYEKRTEEMRREREEMYRQRERMLEEQERFQREAERIREEEEQRRRFVEGLEREREVDRGNEERRRRKIENERRRKEEEERNLRDEEETRQRGAEEKRRLEEEERERIEIEEERRNLREHQQKRKEKEEFNQRLLEVSKRQEAEKQAVREQAQRAKKQQESEDERLAREEAQRLTAEILKFQAEADEDH